EFPSKKHFVKDIHQKFKNLQQYQYKLKDEEYDIPTLVERTDVLRPFQFRGQYALLPSNKTDYYDMNVLSDYFQEQARVCSKAGYRTHSTMTLWSNPKHNKRWLRDVISKEGPIDSYRLREGLYCASKSE